MQQRGWPMLVCPFCGVGIEVFADPLVGERYVHAPSRGKVDTVYVSHMDIARASDPRVFANEKLYELIYKAHPEETPEAQAALKLARIAQQQAILRAMMRMEYA